MNKMSKEVVRLLCCLLLPNIGLVSSCLQLNNGRVSFPASAPEETNISGGFSNRELVVSPSLRFACSGSVSAWEAYFEAAGDCFVVFQVWRPDDTAGNNCNTGTYSLVHSDEYDNTKINSNLYRRFIPNDGPFRVESGDIIGFYVDYEGRGINRQSIQSREEANSQSYVRRVRPNILDRADSLSTCARNLDPVTVVPLIDVVFTQDVVTTLTTGMGTEATTVRTTVLSRTSPEAVQDLDTTATTVSVFTGVNMAANKTTATVPPGNDSVVSLEIVIPAAVLGLVVAAVCLVIIVIIVLCCVQRGRFKKEPITHEPDPANTLSKEERVYELAGACPYEEPVSTLKRELGETIRRPSLMQGRPLPQVSESAYEVPVDSLKKDPVFNNPDQYGVNGLYDLVPEPYAVPTVSLQPNTLKANGSNVYSTVDNSEQDYSLVAEANIYEPLPI